MHPFQQMGKHVVQKSILRGITLCLEFVKSSPPHPSCIYEAFVSAILNNLNLIAYHNIRNRRFKKNSSPTLKVNQVNELFYRRKVANSKQKFEKIKALARKEKNCLSFQIIRRFMGAKIWVSYDYLIYLIKVVGIH